MSMVQIFECLKQKCKESFGDAVGNVLKKFFTWLILALVAIFVFFLIFIRESLDYTFKVSVLQILIIHVGFFIIIGVICLIIYRLRQRVRLSDYCRDVIYGVVWEWDSVPTDTSGDIHLTPICPVCYHELCHYPHPKFYDREMMTCEFCNWTKDLQGDWDSIKFDVTKVIEQRIRNNDWKNAQKRLKALKK